MSSKILKEALLSYYASIKDRDQGILLVKNNPELTDELVQLAFSKKQKREHVVASWVLERLIVTDGSLKLSPYFKDFLASFPYQTHESKRRPFAKLLYHHCKINKNRALLSPEEIENIISCCFDTLIDAKKVAPKAFALKTIVFFKDHEDWIAEELKSYIEKELPTSAAAFKATLRQIMPI